MCGDYRGGGGYESTQESPQNHVNMWYDAALTPQCNSVSWGGKFRSAQGRQQKIAQTGNTASVTFVLLRANSQICLHEAGVVLRTSLLVVHNAILQSCHTCQAIGMKGICKGQPQGPVDSRLTSANRSTQVGAQNIGYGNKGSKSKKFKFICAWWPQIGYSLAMHIGGMFARRTSSTCPARYL